MIGKRFGLLVVLVECDERTKRSRSIVFECRCDCGRVISVTGAKLRMGQRSCGCVHGNALPFGEASFNVPFRNYKNESRKRGLTFALTRDQFRNIVVLDCDYCGQEPAQIATGGRARGSSLNGHFVYNGIDRIDPGVGYVLDNCVPCCKTCNYAKGAMTIGEFVAWVDRVYQHQHEERCSG